MNTPLSEAIQAVADGLIRYEKEIERLQTALREIRAEIPRPEALPDAPWADYIRAVHEVLDALERKCG